MSIEEKIKNVGMGLGGLAISVAIIAIPVVLLFGMTWVSEQVLPWLMPAFLWTLAAGLFVLGPMALLGRTRGLSALGFMVASYVFGTILWVWSLLLTMKLWGVFAVIIGLLIMGVGIVPVAMLAVIFHAQWSSLADIAIMIIATYGARILGLWLANKVDREREVYLE